VQAVASLKLFDNMLVGYLRRRHRGDGLMPGRIKRLTHRRDGLDAELAKDPLQLLQGEINTRDQSLVRLIVLCGLDRPFQIVDDRQQFLQELLISKPDLVPLIPLG